MSKLYETVEKIINAETMEEAENLLYGKDGIPINTKEHYQRIISNFIKKKELIISKNGNEIYFDLDQNISDAWDMIFISEYIQKQIEDEIDALTKEVQRLKSAKASKDEIDKIRQAKNELSNSLASIRKISDLNRITVNSFKPHDNIKAEITKLKEAINVIEKIRGSFEHQDIYGNNNSVTVDKEVVINNPKVKLNVKIPIEYLDGFTKGRIIAREEDKIVLEKTNNIVSPILKELGYDISKIQSFFYNVDPDVLAYLLDHFDNDITKLYQLNITDIMVPNHKLVKLIEIRDKYFPNININDLDVASIIWVDNTEKILKYLSELDYPIDIKLLPREAYYNADLTIKLFEKCTGNLNDLFKYIPDYCWYSPLQNISIDSLKPGDVVSLLKQISYDEITTKNNLSTENLNGVSLGGLKPGEYKNLIKLQKIINKKGLNAFEFCSRPDINSVTINNIIQTINYLEENNINIDNEALYEFDYTNFDVLIEMINLFKQKKLVDLISLNPYMLQILNEDNIKLLKYIVSNFSKECIIQLPFAAFFDAKETYKLIQYISSSDLNIDFSKISYWDYKSIACVIKIIEFNKTNPETIEIEQILPIIYKIGDFDDFNPSRIIELLKKIDYNYSILKGLPNEFFKCDSDILDVMLQRYNSNIAKSIFGINNPKIISLLIYMNNVFSGYNVNNTVDIDMTDYIVEAYEPSDFLKDTLKDTIAYRNNIKDVQMDPVKFFEQFGYGPSKDAIVNTFLERLRNASCHYRIKPVRDRKGNLIEDKVYIFDEDNYGNNNFNIILDIDEALELTRKVEIALENSLDKDDDAPIKSKKVP